MSSRVQVYNARSYEKAQYFGLTVSLSTSPNSTQTSSSAIATNGCLLLEVVQFYTYLHEISISYAQPSLRASES
jgi:hypothetical protein